MPRELRAFDFNDTDSEAVVMKPIPCCDNCGEYPGHEVAQEIENLREDLQRMPLMQDGNPMTGIQASLWIEEARKALRNVPMEKAVYTTALILAASSVQAGGANPPWMEPPVIVPELPFSWDGPYAGLSYGQSQHKRTYSQEVAGVAFEQSEEPWEAHSYSCNRGPDTNSHLRYKCDVTGLTDAVELTSLSNVAQPWNTARDETVRYTSSYDGLWLGADETLAFTLPEYVEPQARDGRWGYVSYEVVRGVTVTEEAFTSYSQQEYTISESDEGFGGFAGYREQWGFTPLVVGAEFNFIQTEDHGNFTQFGAQAGFALGRVLPYVEVGPDHYAGGTDIAFGNVLLGVRTWETHDGDDSGNQVRVGWMF